MTAHASFWLIAIELLVVIYLGICVTIIAQQKKFVYFPVRAKEPEVVAEAARNGLVPFRGDDGKIIAWQTEDGDPDRTVVIFHGNAGNAIRRHYLVAALRAANPVPQPRIVILEYPGYGARKGSPSEKTLTAAAIDLIGRMSGPVVLLGESLGTGLACKVAGLLPGRVFGVALLTPFNRLTAVAKHHYPIFPFRTLFQQRYDSEENLATFPGPVAFLLAENDAVVPSKFGRFLYDGYSGQKRLWFVPGAGHNDISALLPPQEWRDILDFFSRTDAARGLAPKA